jgi:hypothetical protein
MNGRASRPSLIHQKLWLSRRKHYIAVFENALMLLRQRPELPVDEPGLVRELHFASVTARRTLDPTGRFGSPVFEAQNLPDPESERLESFEHKRPDIQWIHDDESASDDRHREKAFVIECKRLGQTTASRWNLNEQYVISGVHRFRSIEWKYGLHMSEGMMIGFVQDMELPAVLDLVNSHIASASLPHLKPEAPFVVTGVCRLNHEFERPFSGSPFTLLHQWIDLRDIPKAAKPAATTQRVPKFKKCCGAA